MILPLAVLVERANDNEKKHAPTLLGKVGYLFDRFKIVVADSQYNSEKVRECIRGLGALPVVPYMSNQKGVGVRRIDKYFRTSVAQLRRGGCVVWAGHVLRG